MKPEVSKKTPKTVVLCSRENTGASVINWDYESLVRDDHPVILLKQSSCIFRNNNYISYQSVHVCSVPFQ